jgi:two-component system, OmpR family, phosphate regulon sensor histidine kinase PhoR
MPFSLLFRRLLLPAVVIILTAAGGVAGLAAWMGRAAPFPIGAFAWAVIGIGGVASLAVALVVYAYGRSQGRAIYDAFGRTIGKGETRGPAQADAIDEAIDNLALSLADRLSQASRDKAQLQTILSSMTDGLVAVDHDQRVLLSNRAAEQLLSLSADAQGRHLWEAMPPAMQTVVQAVAEVMLTNRPRRFVVGPTDGRYIEVTIRRLIAVDGSRPGGLVIVAHDVTEAHQYQELRKEFVANVSHELRTPLTVIKGYIETLRDGAMDDPKAAQLHLAIIQKHADQLSNLVSDLLDLSRLESGQNVPEQTPLSLEPLVQKIVELMQPAARIKNQSLTVKLPPPDQPLPQVMGNADYLQRAIANLIDNAIKYTPERGSIAVEARASNASVLIEVTDTGIGLDEQDLPRIFERFYRVDRSRSREMGGTGLGLSIVKHAIQGHGGSVDVESELDKGSKFIVRLPALARPSAMKSTNRPIPRGVVA